MYLINWLPSAPLKFDIPYTVLFQTEPDYQFLGVFGCSCFPFLHPYQSHKLEFRSSECVFLGYSPSHKGNKYMSSSGRIFMSKDVIFNEHQFPYRKLFSTSSNSVPIASFSTTLPVLESLILLPLQFHLSLKARSPHPLLSLPVLTLLSHSHLILQSQDTAASPATVHNGTQQSDAHPQLSLTESQNSPPLLLDQKMCILWLQELKLE